MLNIILRESNGSKVTRISTGLNAWRKHHASVGVALIVLLCNICIRIQKAPLCYVPLAWPSCEEWWRELYILTQM